ncbi:hypothetical protein J4206_03040 [Candidatus Woesearchaeota archaeon]|nr:hypothetical protein [Candidatus Woesearchaeota archaeon]
MASFEPVARAVREVKNVLLEINLVYSFLDTLIIFLLSFFITFLTNVHWYFAMIPTALYFILHVTKRVGSISLLRVEEKVASLSEQLRTAADNVGRHNEIIDLLNKEVLSKMRDVKVSYFIDFKDLLGKIFAMFCISFLIIFVTSMNVRLVNFGDMFHISEKSLDFDRGSENIASDGRDLEAETQGNSDIFGDPSVREAGKNPISLQLNPVESEINLNEFKEVEPKDFDNAPAPGEISAQQDAAYDREIAREYKEVVKNYFDKIT